MIEIILHPVPHPPSFLTLSAIPRRNAEIAAGRKKEEIFDGKKREQACKKDYEGTFPSSSKATDTRKLYNTEEEEEEEEPPSAEKAQKPKRRRGGTLPSSDNFQEDT